MSTKIYAWVKKNEGLFRLIEISSLVFAAWAVFQGFTVANQLTWLSALESRSLALEKSEYEDPDIACLYIYKNKKLNDTCKESHLDFKALRKNILYAEALVDLFIAVEKYDLEYSDNTFNEGYKLWASELMDNNYFKKWIYLEMNDQRIKYIDQKAYQMDINLTNMED